jgi:hypothetical protein
MDLIKFFTGMASLAAAMALTACSQDEADIQPSALTQGNVISLTSQVAATRAASDPQTTALSTSNKVGVYVSSSSSTLYNNVEHSVGDAGALTATTTMNYPTEDGATVNIYAYAPYASSLELSSDNAFSVSTDQSAESGYLASDLVYASKTGQASTSDAVSLTFAHKLSQLQIVIQNDANINLTNASVYVTGTKIATTFNPSTGTVGAASGDATAIKAANISAASTVYAIVVPQDIAANTELVKITTSDKTYIAKLTSAVTFAAGKAHSFTARIAPNEVELTLNASSITEWGSPTDFGSADMEEAGATPLEATISKPSSVTNATWDAASNTYSWTATNNNLIDLFTFSSGELANYNTLTFTLSSLSGGMVRVGYYAGSSFTELGTGFGSNGTKTVDLTSISDRSTVTKISFGGRAGSGDSSGSVVLTDVKLTK